jgi:putative CocE/NonD family hydrolase
MANRCRLAVDVYPWPDSPSPVPTILIFTPYYRRFALKAGAPAGAEACPGVARWRDLFVPRGYALVAVDVRGTGASFGTRDSLRSLRERDDYARIADWVVAQPWSDGRLGATGISWCRRQRLPRQLGESCGPRNRAAFGGMGHLYRPLLAGRSAVEPAGPVL